MITLYHCPNARSFRILWLLEEVGLDYQLEMMNFPPRLHAPEYLAINPLGNVPFMTDGEERLFESSAMLIYLASRGNAELARKPDDPGYGEWLSWITYGEADLTTPLATALRYAMFAPEERKQPEIAADQVGLFGERLRRAAARLESADYLSGDDFSAADISVGYALMLSRVLGAHKQWPDAVQSYWNRLKERPAFLAAKKAQEPPQA